MQTPLVLLKNLSELKRTYSEYNRYEVLYNFLVSKRNAFPLHEIGHGLECIVLSNDKLPFVVKLYHDKRDMVIPPNELIGSVFVDMLAFDTSLGVLIQEKVDVLQDNDKNEVAFLTGTDCLFHTYDVQKYSAFTDKLMSLKCRDLHSRNIGFKKCGHPVIVDYGCYSNVQSLN